jgi:hypothetical protein
MTEEDKRFYDTTIAAPILTPADLEGHTENEVLMHMWEYAPDVNEKFGLPAVPKVYGWDQKRGDNVKQSKRSYINRLAGGSSLLPGPSMVLQTSKPSEGEIVIKTAPKGMPVSWPEIKVGKDIGVHVTDEGDLRFRAKSGEPAIDVSTKADPTEQDEEIERLREKLKAAGIDPDA